MGHHKPCPVCNSPHIRIPVTQATCMTCQTATPKEAPAMTPSPTQADRAHAHRRTLGLHPNLSVQQRRVLATDRLTYLGTDAKDRPVVEMLVGIPQQSRTWAVLRSGDPVDVVPPVSLAHRSTVVD